MKDKKQYAMLQLDKDLHEILRKYCKEHGYLMKGFVQNLIKKALKNEKNI